MSRLAVARLKARPRLFKVKDAFNFSKPKIDRIAEHGGADMDEVGAFSETYLHTNLKLNHYSPNGELLQHIEAGGGKITNVGVLALAQQFQWAVEGKNKEAWDIFSNLKFQAWSEATTESEFSVKMTSLKKPNETEATEVESRTFQHNLSTEEFKGKPKLILKGKIKAEGTYSIKSWGVFTAKVLEGAAKGGGKFTSVTENSGTITGATEFTASSDEIKGERLQIALASESEPTWLFVKKNSKTVLEGEQGTVSQKKMWFLETTGKFKQPTATSAFVMRPILWDQKKFETVGVENLNEIEFIYELEFPSGG